MKAARLFACLLLGLLLVSCSGAARKVGPVRLTEFERHGWSGADVSLEIGNASAHRLRILSAELTFFYDSTAVGTATLTRKLTIEKRSLNRLHSRWQLRTEDPAAAYTLQKRIEERRYDRIALGYRLTVRAGLAKKTFSQQMVPLSEFLSTFEPSIYPEDETIR